MVSFSLQQLWLIYNIKSSIALQGNHDVEGSREEVYGAIDINLLHLILNYILENILEDLTYF